MGTRQITNYKVVNPAAGDVFFDTAGTATTDTTQPTLNVGRATNLGNASSTSSVGMTFVEQGDRGRTIFGSQLIVSARQSVQGAEVAGATAITSVADTAGGLANYTLAGHGLSVGDSIIVLDASNDKGLTGPQRVISETVNTFVTDKIYAAAAGALTYGVVVGDFAIMTAEQYIIRRVNNVQFHGVANNLLRSGSSDYAIRRSIHKVETAYRSDGAALAVRLGYWDIYGDVWSTAPTPTNTSIGDVTGGTVDDGTADNAAMPSCSIPGELAYRQGGQQTAGTDATDGVQLDDYQPKTG